MKWFKELSYNNFMQIKYPNKSKKSSIDTYEIGNGGNSIAITFNSGSSYVYDHNKPGKEQVDKMKELAAAGEGLGSYVKKNVNKNFASFFKAQ